MIPLWLWTAFAGLAVGMAYAWWEKRTARNRPASQTARLKLAAVDEITTLISDKKQVKAIKLLRLNTGLSLLDAKNRVDDWRADEERAAAR